MPKTVISKLSVFAALAVAAQCASAQPPIEFTNTPEAVRLFEAGTLDTLRERCPLIKANSLLGRPEPLGLLNGYVFVTENKPKPGRYSVFVYDQDKRSFSLIDGQSLVRNGRLTVPLALPRDYARCRIVRGPAGLEQLEVVHVEKNYVSDLQSMQRLVDEAKDLGAQLAAGQEPCDSPPTSTAPAPLDQLKAGGVSMPLSGCHAAALTMRDRMTRILRKVYER